MVGTLAKDGDQFSGAIDRLEQLVTGLSQDRDPIGDRHRRRWTTAPLRSPICSTEARPPLAGTVDQLNRLAPAARRRQERPRRRAAEGARELPQARPARRLRQLRSTTTSAGSSFRVTDLQGRTAVFPWIKQETGRCAEP